MLSIWIWSSFILILCSANISSIFYILLKWFQSIDRNEFKKRQKLPLKVLRLMTRRILKYLLQGQV